MFLRLAVLSAAFAVLLSCAPAALASGGHYTFSGGTPAERGQVVQALQASAFPWDIVPETIVIHIGASPVTEATPGAIWLAASILDAGRFSWGVVQHEFAHQVDFLVLTQAQRDSLSALLGGTTWWNDGGSTHSMYGCERFASSIAWAYWPASDNVLRPAGPRDEAGAALSPAAFRTALAALLPGAEPNEPLAGARTVLATPDKHVSAAALKRERAASKRRRKA